MGVIGAKGLRKRYGGTVALQEVSLELAGGVFALIGPNGAGKTTLIRCLTGTTTPDRGSATILGAPPERVDRARIGVLPQAFDPPTRLTPRELIRYFAELYPRPRGVDRVLERIGMTDAADTRYANLSGGEQRRTLVGTAVVNDPEVLFLDEPTTGIDPAGRRAIWSVITELTAAGTTVFLTTHDMAEAEQLADRIGVIADGTMVATGPPRELIADHGGPPTLIVEAASGGVVELPYPTTRTEDSIVIEGVEPDEITTVVEALNQDGISYDSLLWREPDLETVYFSLTGEPPADQQTMDPVSRRLS